MTEQGEREAPDDKLPAMNSVHLVIPDLFLPQEIAAEACAGLALPALETLLARAQPESGAAESLEAWLCTVFGVAGQAIAPVCLRADGLEPGEFYWLRADPVYLSLQRDQLILHPQVQLAADEAVQLCASLNAHFAADNLRFFAPHPQRWYLRLDGVPDMSTRPLAQVEGCNVFEYLPQGQDALYWHGVFNEIQMLLYEHEVNQAREARGELPINSVWLWGGGCAAGELARPYTMMYGDSDLASAFAQAAGIPHALLPEDATQCDAEGDMLIVVEVLRRAHQQGDLHAWRAGLQRVEQCCAKPLLDALRSGRIARLTLEIPQAGAARRLVLSRGAAWKLWQRPRPLASYAV